jgi:hypothetical protein
MTGSLNPENAEAILAELDGVFLQNGAQPNGTLDLDSPNVEARYRALVEQIPAVVFMAYLDVFALFGTATDRFATAKVPFGTAADRSEPVWDRFRPVLDRFRTVCGSNFWGTKSGPLFASF